MNLAGHRDRRLSENYFGPWSVGHQSLAKEASKYTEEYCLQLLKLQYPDLACVTEEGEVVPREKL